MNTRKFLDILCNIMPVLLMLGFMYLLIFGGCLLKDSSPIACQLTNNTSSHEVLCNNKTYFVQNMNCDTYGCISIYYK